MGVATQCRVGFVGAGYMAREHARAFAALDGVTLVAVTSRTRQRAEALADEFSIQSVAESVEDLYQTHRPDLVIVAVPELSMRPTAVEAFRFPWTVLLEKPAGHNLAEAESIAGAAADSGCRVFVALNRRFYGSTRRVREDLEKRAQSRFVVIQDQQSIAGARQIGHPADVAENFMYANSVHVIDLGRHLCRGNVSEVRSILAWNPEAPGVVAALILFDSGDRALYEGIWDGPGPWAVTVNTPAVRWDLRPLERATRQLQGERTLLQYDPDPEDTEFKAGLLLQARAGVEAALGRATELPDINDSLASMRLVAAIFGHR